MDDGVRGSILPPGASSGAQLCSPGRSFQRTLGHVWASPSLQGEVGPPGLPGPLVSVLAVGCVGGGGKRPPSSLEGTGGPRAGGSLTPLPTMLGPGLPKGGLGAGAERGEVGGAGGTQ